MDPALAETWLWQQRRGWGLGQRRLTAGGQVRQHIPPLLTARLHDTQNVGDEPAAPGAPRAVACAPPEYRVPQRPLGRIVGRFHARDTRVLKRTGGTLRSALLEVRRSSVPGDLHPRCCGRQDHPPRVSLVRHAHHYLGANDRPVKYLSDSRNAAGVSCSTWFGRHRCGRRAKHT